MKNKIIIIVVPIIIVIGIVIFLILKFRKSSQTISEELHTFPKKIYKIYIENGHTDFNNLPKEIKRIHNSWKKNNPEYDLIYFS